MVCLEASRLRRSATQRRRPAVAVLAAVFLSQHLSGAGWAQPAGIELAASLDVPAELVALDGGYVYAAAGDTLHVVEVTNPAAPVLRGALTAPGRIWSVHAAGNRAYLAGGLDGLHIVDAADPDAPALAATHQTAGQALGVTTSGGAALVINLMTGLEIVDVTDGGAPALVHTEETFGYQWSIGGGGAQVLVADQPEGVHIFDVSDPAAPVLQGVYSGAQQVRAVTAGDDRRAYVVLAGSGVVEIVDIADPSNPRRLAAHTPAHPGGRTQRVAVRAGHMAVPVADGGIEWVDVSDPAAPVLAATHDTPGTAQDAAIAGDILAVADGDALRIYRIR